MLLFYVWHGHTNQQVCQWSADLTEVLTKPSVVPTKPKPLSQFLNIVGPRPVKDFSNLRGAGADTFSTNLMTNMRYGVIEEVSFLLKL